MPNVSRFGVFLPSFIWSDDGPGRARGIIDFAKECEGLGFGSIFITDHLLTARRLYSVSFLEPLTTLSLVAGVTDRIMLGTSVMVLPIREPVSLAKQIATLHFLSGGRFILGAGIGWYPPEYAATGVSKSERGPRTDEILDVIVPLLEGQRVSYAGQYYSIEDVEIEPRTTGRPEVWIGGGSQLADPASPEAPRFAETVKRRILRSEGWIPRPTCPPEDIRRDWEELQAFMTDNGRDPGTVTVAHENFMHFVPTQDPQAARREQHDAFLRVMSTERGPEYLEQVYLFGTPEEIVESLQARADAGVEQFMLHTLTPDPAQLEQWIEHVIPHVRFPNGD
ncbi:MAG TPA: LLM class flavin-dependent oxidoreductase [Acidimicrobiia bacterium]|nr:LLM class flavin-dependent oxidoreductase [Acidimicrobiia bacterium]